MEIRPSEFLEIATAVPDAWEELKKIGQIIHKSYGTGKVIKREKDHVSVEFPETVKSHMGEDKVVEFSFSAFSNGGVFTGILFPDSSKERFDVFVRTKNEIEKNERERIQKLEKDTRHFKELKKKYGLEMIQESSPRSIAYMALLKMEKGEDITRDKNLKNQLKKDQLLCVLARAHEQRGEIAQARSIWRKLEGVPEDGFLGEIIEEDCFIEPFPDFSITKKQREYESGRDTHCWNCKTGLNSEQHSKCNVCGWMICPDCGACGCGYSR